jgi:hypothetical protein
MHIVMAVIDMTFLFSIITSGAVALRGRFRVYSIATILIMLIFGAVAGMQAPSVAADLPTPWVGLIERIDVYAAMIWLAVFATFLGQPDMSRPMAQSR